MLSAQLPADGIGIYDIRLRMPVSLPVESVARLIVSQNGFTSNTVTFPVKSSAH